MFCVDILKMVENYKIWNNRGSLGCFLKILLKKQLSDIYSKRLGAAPKEQGD